MPAAIPDRYRREIRLGRDDDIEEWLATDTSLDRPVLLRSLGPETSSERRKQFVASVSGAAKASHPHLAKVFAVDEVKGGAYSVSEWTGGASVADRIDASQPIELPDFLPNASGLAGALAALHDRGIAHGAIDPQAISYSAAHAAKLGAFGRVPRADASGDVRALAAALETSLTGFPPGGPPPSERVDGVPRSIDRILRLGQSGELTASGLEEALRAAPTPRAPQPESRSASRKLLIAALGLVVVAVGLVALGLVFSPGGETILPTIQPPTTEAPGVTTTTVRTTTSAAAGVLVDNVATFDPYGEGGEHDDDIPNLTDGDETSAWRTEQYQDPLQLLKPGVGVTFTVRGAPSGIQLVGLSENTGFELYFSETFFADVSGWSRIMGGKSGPGTTEVDLPRRPDGFWMLWLIDLPAQAEGTYYSTLAEVRFLP